MTHYQPFQQRVVDEKAELDEKIKGLSAFVDTQTFHNLDIDERGHLLRQLVLMRGYSAVLGERITAFKVQQ